MDIVFFVEVDGVIWKVMTDGSWVQVDSSEPISPDIPILNATLVTSEVGNTDRVDEQADDQELNASTPIPDDITDLFEANLANNPYSNNTANSDISSVSSSGLILTGYVRPELTETLAQAGFQTRDTLSTSDDERPEQTDNTFYITSQTTITVTIEDGGDGYENRFEVPSVTIFGSTTSVRDGITIDVVVTDIEGNQLLLTAVAQNDQYRIEGVDLSGLAEGQLQVTATVSDITGNSVSANDDTIKDTLADIQGGLDGFGDATINQVEQSQDRLFGTVSNVESGQPITIYVSDVLGNQLQFETQVRGSAWVINDIDLSSLSDGNLTVTTETIDIAGNPAVDVSMITKDTFAEITIQIDDGDGQVDLFEAPSMRLFGSVDGIEDGQPVEITVTDSAGTTQVFNTTVVNQAWEITGADFTVFVDGVLSAVVSSVDSVGNTAQSQDTSEIVLDASITVDILDGGDGYENRFEVPTVTIEGTTDKVPDGATILITITDIDGVVVTTSAVANSGTYQVQNVDLSSLAEGTLTVKAEVDSSYKTVEAFDDTIKDTLADVSGEIDGLGDTYINFDEQNSATLFGSVSNIENGQSIEITITDEVGNQITLSTTVDGNLWQIDNVDLSALQDGNLTTFVSSIDIAGNPASSESTIVKDTVASITIDIEDGGDNVLNNTEWLNTRIFGAVTDIEDGQPVTVTVSDSNGATLSFTTTVVNGAWEVSNIDLSSFAEGEVTAIATTVDVAGNSASATSDASTIDLTVPTIDIDTLSGFDIFYFREGSLTSIQGTTTGVDEGLPVTITLSDGTLSFDFSANVDASGAWLVEGLDISGLDSSSTWTLTANVANAIGNEAADDMPTLVFPDQVLLSETFVGIFGENSASSTINIENAEFTFDENQEALLSLVSSGQSLSMALSADKKSITVTRSGGDVVLEAEIVDGQVDITLYKGLDDSRPGDLQTELVIRGTQTDADGTIEEVLAPVILAVQDSRPLAINDGYTVTEGKFATGNVLSNDADLDGGLRVRQVVVDNESKSVSSFSPAVFDLPEGKLFVFANGQWLLEAARNLDHQNLQSINLTYVAGDDSIDYDTADATITIVDGETGSISSDDQLIVERDLTKDAVINSGTFLVAGGSDSPDPDSIRFDESSLAVLDSLLLTSGTNLVALTYELSPDGKTITATAISTTVFTISISAVAQDNNVIATTEISLDFPLNQDASNDIIYLPLRIIGEDMDGTVLESGEFVWQIKDGVDPVVTEGTTISISEDELNAQSVSKTGDFSLSLGSDPIRTAAFDLSEFPTLTSEGRDIVYTINPDGNVVTAYQDDVRGDVVFVVYFDMPQGTVDETLTYTFAMDKALDQSSGTDTLNFPITITDTDGDKTSLNLKVDVTDASSGVLSVEDMEVSERPVDPNYSGVADVDTASITVSASKDPIVDLILSVSSGDQVFDSNGNSITHNGASVFWQEVGDGSYQGELADGTVIFVVTLPDDFVVPVDGSNTAEVQFQLRQQLDHNAEGQGAQLSILLPVSAIDTDGTLQSGESEVVIYDGLTPALTVNGDITISEDGLLTNDDNTGVETNTPTISVDMGSDEFKEFVINIDQFNGLLVESQGNLVTLQDKDSDGWYIGQDTNSDEVFRIRILDDGSVEFELSKPLDHNAPSELVDGLPLDTNLKALDFEVAVVDFDDDVSQYQTVTVNVTDDVPESRTTEIELVEGDDVTDNLLTPSFQGADGASINGVSYNGVDYDLNDFVDGKLTIDLLYTPDSTAVKYGELTVSTDGTFRLTTNEFVDNEVSLTDSVEYTVIDADGDTVKSIASLILDDAKGVLRTPDTETREDVSSEISITLILGDLDQNETVESIDITEASLGGGSLYLDGVELLAVDGLVTLSGSQLQSLANEVYIPNGQLTYLPAQHQSNTTSTVALDISATIRNADSSTKVLTNTLNVSVLPVADTPEWNDDSRFDYTTIEDASDFVQLDLSAALVDTDTSESLSYQFSDIPDGITIYLNDKIVKEGKSYTQQQLDKMTIIADDNLAGVFEFEVTAIATEQGNSFAQAEDQTASTTRTVTISVSPDADIPELSVRNIDGLEDQFIPLNEAIKGNLTDTDGSESLFYEIVVPDGWSIQGTIVSQSGNTYLVEASDVESGEIKLISKADISSVTESLSIDVTAVSRESTVDGLTPIRDEARSDTKTISIDLKGVIDEPTVVDGGSGHWQFDSSAGDNDGEITSINPFNEDNLVALDFLVKTTDDDESEVINILLTNLPTDIRLVDINGDPVTLTIADVDPVTGPIIQFDNAQLANTYIKTPQDFSGQIALTVRAITTEPDGDTGAFDYDLKIDIAPVVDQSDGQTLSSVGIEDRSLALDLNLSVDADIDGSEELVDYYIDGVSDGLTLYFDDVVQTIPDGGLSLSDFIDGTSPTLDVLLTSGRITVQADRDLSGDFTVDLRYTVKDTSETGLTTTKELTGTASVLVEGRVEFDTRLEATTRLLESTDGSPIDLSNAVWFVEEDVDGSEYLDYIVLEVPDGVNLIVEHPNGAAQNAAGDWIISADGLTSDSVQDVMAKILQDATIRSPQNTDIVTIGVKARVLDDPDADFISTQFDIRIIGHDGGGGSCGDVGEPGDITDGSEIQFNEGETIDLSGLLNTDIADDPDNKLSFYVPADSLPEGVFLEGEGIIVEYNEDGTVAGYSVSPEALSTLTLYGVDEDFAGCIEFTVVTVETSTCNGTSNETNNTIKLEVLPVVDDFNMIVGNGTIQEDTTTDIDLALVLGDSIELGQSITGEGSEATGKETVNSMVITVPEGVILSDTSNDSSYITDNGDNTYTITDVTRLGDIALTPPEHFSGDLTIRVDTQITDQATCVDEIDTQTKTSEFTITVEPIADLANLTVANIRGDEDSYISLGTLSAELIDQDGSENMSLSITGVPTDAVLVVKVGDDYQLLPNNGLDGGTFGGNPTYEWQVTTEQLPDVYLLPPLDYSGDIPLALEAITQEIGTTDIRYTTGNFTVGVNPIGDDIQFFDVPTHVSGNENDPIKIATNLISQETDSDEYIQLTVTAEADSDASALVGLNRIRAAGNEAKFTSNNDGTWSATLTVTASTLASFELFAGDAHGALNLTLEANTVDQQIVLGSRASDQGDVTSTSLMVNITPEVDPPELTLNYDSIIAEATGTVPLGIEMALVNPALGEEQGSLLITGVPDNLTLSHGTREGSVYVVDVEDVASLSIASGYNGAQTFTLAIEGEATLDNQSATSPFETLEVVLAEVGETEFTATAGNDSFVFQTSGLGSADTPTVDTIIDFDVTKDTDVIDLEEIFTNLNIVISDGLSAENYLTLAEQGSDVELLVNTDKANDPDAEVVNQKIVLKDITLDQLYGTSSADATQAELLQKMIDDNNLNVPTS